MNKNVTQTAADIITSLGMVIFVLLMTVIAMIFVGHGLYYQVFIKCMAQWQAEIASWVLSFGIESTVLIITCNVRYFSGKWLPAFFAVCSGFIVLFFIKAFDFSQTPLDLAVRWFMGLLVSGVNYVYCELFVKKLGDIAAINDLLNQIDLFKRQNGEYSIELANNKAELTKAKRDVERLVDYVAELEVFKKKAVAEKSCRFCGREFQSVFHVNSHMRNCESNPKRGEKLSVFASVA